MNNREFEEHEFPKVGIHSPWSGDTKRTSLIPRTTNSHFWEFVFFELPVIQLLPHYKWLTQGYSNNFFTPATLQRIYKLRKSALFKNCIAQKHTWKF